MNAIVTQPTQLPAHLQFLAQTNIGAAAMGGITAGQSIHQISIKGSKWRLQDTQGNETIAPTHHIDVLIVDANPNLSKIFYAGAYNAADTEYKAPDCYSDNGVSPSSRASKPQSASCATCPHNVWGSKVTPMGTQTRACADSKKLAVVLADNPTGAVYLLKIPPATLKNMFTFVESLQNRGIPLPAVVVRLGFDTEADYPKITFTPTGYASEVQIKAIQAVIGTEEVKTVIGLNDKPAPARAAIAAPVETPPTPVIVSDPFAQFSQPVAAPVTQSAPVSVDPFAGLMNTTPAVPAEAPKRKRRSKAEMEAAGAISSGTQVPNMLAGAAASLSDIPAHMAAGVTDVPNAIPAAAAVILTPQPTTTALDELIANALKA